MSFGFELLIILLMLLINAVFAAYEMSLASISRARLSTLAQQKKRGAEEAAFMKDRMEASLAVVQLGITLAGAVAAATGGAGVQENIVPYLTSKGIPHFYSRIISLLCLVIPLSSITIIFGELVPKMFALENREFVCLTLSPVMKFTAGIADPVVRFFEGIVKKIMAISAEKIHTEGETQTLHELRAAAAFARTSRLIGAHEESIVLSAAQLSQRKVKDIMLDAEDIFMIPINDSLSEALVKAHLDMHTRFPVCEKTGDPQTIVGYLNFKDIINALRLSSNNPSIRGITRPIKKIPDNTPLTKVLLEMMRERTHIVIINSGDTIVGMVTMEDIIEELVGEIEDEFDRLPVFVQQIGSGWIIGGGVSIRTVASTLGIDIPTDPGAERLPTLAEWIMQKLDRDIEGGETVTFDNISITVRKIRRRKLAEALVVKT
jgi:putative hemolysin